MKNLLRKISRIIPDKPYILLQYRIRRGFFPNLKNPKLYTEKLQWLKLYDRQEKYTLMVDKYEAKKYIAKMIGPEYAIPTLGIWDCFEEIDFEQLPEQFVLKTNHDSGAYVICTDKSKLDIEKAKKKLNGSLKNNYYWHGREWPYKGVKPRIIAEPFLKDPDQPTLVDYKFFCFEGTPKFVYVTTETIETSATDFYDMNYERIQLKMQDPNSEEGYPKPKNFEKMKELAAILCQGHHHLRVDFYEINGQIYCGEMTFYHRSGYVKIEPENWETIMGSWIKLPTD